MKITTSPSLSPNSKKNNKSKDEYFCRFFLLSGSIFSLFFIFVLSIVVCYLFFGTSAQINGIINKNNNNNDAEKNIITSSATRNKSLRPQVIPVKYENKKSTQFVIVDDYNDKDTTSSNDNNVNNDNDSNNNKAASVMFVMPDETMNSNTMEATKNKDVMDTSSTQSFVVPTFTTAASSSTAAVTSIRALNSPKLVLLLTFPNSGTSYTMSMVSRASQTATATNYGREVTKLSDEYTHQVKLPSYYLDHTAASLRYPIGPFYKTNYKTIERSRKNERFLATLDSNDDNNEDDDTYYSEQEQEEDDSASIASTRPLPTQFLLTKTHCGLRCVDCHPLEYINVTQADFWPDSCTHGSAKLKYDPVEGTKDGDDGTNQIENPEFQEYDRIYDITTHVGKSIHLIRSPMNNIIARFHLERKHSIEKNEMSMNGRNDRVVYENTPQGFQNYCSDLDTKYEKELRVILNMKNFPLWYDKYFKDVPCHGEFYKYTKWHSFVMKGLEFNQIPTLRIFYEDYYNPDSNNSDNRDPFHQQNQVLEYLELEKKEEFKPFESHDNTYTSYFTDEQRRSIKNLIQRVANPKFYDIIKDRYFN